VSGTAVAVFIDIPTMTREQYDAIIARLGWDRAGVALPEGLVVHAAGPTDGGWRIVDIWASEDSFRNFSSGAIRNAVEGLGIPAYTPEVIPLHHVARP
jgi:hypothetical protein